MARTRRRERSCHHLGSTLVVSQLGYHARCSECGTLGPGRPNTEAARKALLVLGARDSHVGLRL